MAHLTQTAVGPLPATLSFTTGSDGPATLIVYGSVWSSATDVEIGINADFEGQVVGAATIYSNAPSTHRAVVPGSFSVTLDKAWPDPSTPPTYEITLYNMNSDTTSDSNDNFLVVLAV